MQKKDLTLSISHNIFLSREQRYSLHSGKKVSVIGSSLPVWFYKGATSEPAEEVFCRYIVTNKKEAATTVKIGKVGYSINLPQMPLGHKRPELTNEEWRAMTEGQRSEWYKKHPVPLSSERLLDLNDGGTEGFNFRVNEVRYLVDAATGRNTKKEINVIHLISIKDKEVLLQSLTDY